MNRLIPVIAAILLPSFFLQGQVSDSELRVADTPKRFVKDEISISTSPFRRSSYDSRATKKYLVPFAVITATRC